VDADHWSVSTSSLMVSLLIVVVQALSLPQVSALGPKTYLYPVLGGGDLRGSRASLFCQQGCLIPRWLGRSRLHFPAP
ncbi:unnamed protein product, partial [Brassica rapa]